MNKSLKKIWNVLSSILVALVVLLALLLVGARVVGLQVFTVLSGSIQKQKCLLPVTGLCRKFLPTTELPARPATTSLLVTRLL